MPQRGRGKIKNRRSGRAFWDHEYRRGDHLALSETESEDLVKFTRYLERESGRAQLNPLASVLDLGCGNGRNLVYLAETYGMRGIGYDSSGEAIRQAKELGKNLPLAFEVRSIAEPLALEDATQTLVLDMMVSHYLNEAQRSELVSEIARVLKPGGWLFFKTFLLEEDLHAQRLLREHPAEEAGSYIHPEIGVPEHVFTEAEIENALAPHFSIHKTLKSHRHRAAAGHAAKRRSISVYAQKNS